MLIFTFKSLRLNNMILINGSMLSMFKHLSLFIFCSHFEANELAVLVGGISKEREFVEFLYYSFL